MSDDPNYLIGYRKPPKHTQFKPGRSGNPKGRPKGARNFDTDVREILGMKVKVRDEKGRSRKKSTTAVVLLKLREKALKGDPKAMDRILELAAQISAKDTVKQIRDGLADEDRDIIDAFLKRNPEDNHE
ncbi:MAG: DUF5681 domain-containing protein [Pseudomonadota bacterium]